jgi:hypothetical protein
LIVGGRPAWSYDSATKLEIRIGDIFTGVMVTLYGDNRDQLVRAGSNLVRVDSGVEITGPTLCRY